LDLQSHAGDAVYRAARRLNGSAARGWCARGERGGDDRLAVRDRVVVRHGLPARRLDLRDDLCTRTRAHA
jgi:hypothetical protein